MSNFTRALKPKTYDIYSCILGRNPGERPQYTVDKLGQPVRMISQEQAVLCDESVAKGFIQSVEDYTVNNGFAFGSIAWTSDISWDDAMSILPSKAFVEGEE